MDIFQYLISELSTVSSGLDNHIHSLSKRKLNIVQNGVQILTNLNKEVLDSIDKLRVLRDPTPKVLPIKPTGGDGGKELRLRDIIPLKPLGLSPQRTGRCSGLGLGDCLMPLQVFRALGGGDYTITPFNTPYPSGETHPYNSKNGYRENTYKNLTEFIAVQPYITNASIHDWAPGQLYDYDFDLFRFIPNDSHLKVPEHQAWLYGAEVNWDEAWLTAPVPKRRTPYILVHWTPRGYNNHIRYDFLRQFNIPIWLIGLESECEEFQKRWDGLADRCIVCKDFFELGSLLNGCMFFVGVSSSPCVFADGLKTRTVLIKHDADDWYYSMRGDNAIEVWDGEAFQDAVLAMMAKAEAELPKKRAPRGK